MITLSIEQKQIVDCIVKWFKNAKDQVMVVSGYAGTGKTTVMSHLPSVLPDTTRITFNAYTGKATSVLLDKLKQANIWSITVSTIHKLIYVPDIKKDDDGCEFIDGWIKNETIPFDLIVIDEASMISEEIFKDLLEFDKPILFIGDSAQLPPIVGDFNLMNAPDLSLTSIHRQAEDSPIIKISQYIRENGVLPKELNTKFTKEITWWKKDDKEFFNKIPFLNPNIITLSALNRTRKNINNHIRGLCGYNGADIINPGERVVCLKNNDIKHDYALHYVMNGITGTVNKVIPTGRQNLRNIKIDFDIYKSTLPCISDIRTFGEVNRQKLNKIGGDPVSKDYAIFRKQKTHNMFDYGYCITCHKAQGSEWGAVVVIDERSNYSTDDDYKRWLYTAVTRSSNRLFIVKGYS